MTKSSILKRKYSIGYGEKFTAHVGAVYFQEGATSELPSWSPALGNYCDGFPFEYMGRVWQDSQRLYLCGKYSSGSPKHCFMQNLICSVNTAMKTLSLKNPDGSRYMAPREDFGEFRLDWMLHILWTKCQASASFRELLLSQPNTLFALINAWSHDEEAFTWGYDVINESELEGENNLGKMLMMCRRALVEGVEPEIDYELLRSKKIIILGMKAEF